MPDPLPSRLLREAIDYALASASLVTPALLPAPTPCAAWNLGMLLSHLSESVDALSEGLTHGEVHLAPLAGSGPGPEPASLRAGCARLHAAVSAVPTGRLVSIAGHDLGGGVLAGAGAVEVAVHGWDISAACGSPRPIPPGLAARLLCAARVLIPASARFGLFAEPVPPPAGGGEADSLLAYLGRESRQWKFVTLHNGTSPDLAGRSPASGDRGSPPRGYNEMTAVRVGLATPEPAPTPAWPGEARHRGVRGVAPPGDITRRPLSSERTGVA